MHRAIALLLVLAGLIIGGLWFKDQRAESLAPAPLPGSYTVEMNVISGEGHQQYIQMPHTIKLGLFAVRLGEEDAEASFLGPFPFVAVHSDNFIGDEIDKGFAIGSLWHFHMSGTGTVAGHENVFVTFIGQFDVNGAVTGTYTMGALNELPGGYPIEYQVKNSIPPPTYTGTPTATPTNTPLPTLDVCVVAGNSCAATDTPTPPAKQETVAQFLELFNTALQTGDESFLLARLNPHVIEAYGEANCAATVAAMIDPTSSFTINSISGPASWTWSESGTPILVDNVYTVSVKRVVLGKSSVQDIHLAVVQGHLTWFRSCPASDAPTATVTPGPCKIAGGSCPPTDTPTPPAVPPTWTPTPRPGNGDCNHDANTNAIDALLVLQYTAGLVPWPGACADVNGSGAKDAIDVTLILQYIADLIGHLPWP